MKNNLIAIRNEEKKGERRTPLVPQDIQTLIKKAGLSFIVQSSKQRIFSDQEFAQVGAKIKSDVLEGNLIIGIKEIPAKLIEKQKVYLFFSHTIKGQKYNMPLLAKIMAQKATLIDYERIVDEKNRRLIFFGQEAGQAGLINTLWAFGQRLKFEGIENPFFHIKQAHQYKDLQDALDSTSKVGQVLMESGFAAKLAPLVIGIAGYGHVSHGVQQILDHLPVTKISPDDLPALFQKKSANNKTVYKVVFHEEHLVEPISKSDKFVLQDYYDHPEKYRSKFQQYLPYLTILVNCIFWTLKYPRFVTKHDAKNLNLRLKVIGDISCDINGAIEFTAKATTQENPVFVYNPKNDTISDGLKGEGIAVMAIDNLPSELPKDASRHFSNMLKKYIPDLAQANFSASFKQLKLPAELKRAIIVYQGELTPYYKYLEEYLKL
ncbi:MAG: bifunctional lysine ketoglutarate reductase /saccharopine dehydrogenase family protein [Pseudomonadota bacterium]